MKSKPLTPLEFIVWRILQWYKKMGYSLPTGTEIAERVGSSQPAVHIICKRRGWNLRRDKRKGGIVDKRRNPVDSRIISAGSRKGFVTDS